MRTQMADSHLIYIPGRRSVGRRYAHAFYDVYGPGTSPQLGTVERFHATWIARDLTGNSKVGDARWKVATAMWGTS